MNQQAPIFKPRTIYDYFQDAIIEHADRPAIDFLGTKLKYHDLSLMVDKTASALQALGVVKGDRIGLCLPNCPYYTIFYFAILKAGGIVVNFNPLYVVREMEHQARDAQIKLMVTFDFKQIYEKVDQLHQKQLIEHVIVCPFGDILPLIKWVYLNTRKRGELAKYTQSKTHICFRALHKYAKPEDFKPVRIEPEDVALLQYCLLYTSPSPRDS